MLRFMTAHFREAGHDASVDSSFAPFSSPSSSLPALFFVSRWCARFGHASQLWFIYYRF